MLKDKTISRQLNGDHQQLYDVAGQRLTRQRALLFDLIRQGGHPDADELYRRAKEKEPRLSMSTVYRNLQFFVKLGIVEEHHFDNARCFYEVKGEAEHQHIMCLGCGRIIEFACPLSQVMKANLEAEHAFHITGAKVLLVGYCADCFTERSKFGDTGLLLQVPGEEGHWDNTIEAFFDSES